jgi:plasmid rolling circle replication initiator protein Rep
MCVLTPVSSAPLDTSAQLRNCFENNPKTGARQDRTLHNRARAKLITNTLVLRLVDVPDTPLKKAYWRTYHCASKIEQSGKTLTTKYCKNRWCMVCNRIRTSVLIKGYEPALKKLEEPYFVTLTFPNVGGAELQSEIKEMYASFRRIKDRMKKRGFKLKGLRKLECTHNPITGKFNPHYHLLIEGRKHAHMVVQEWLKEYPEAVRRAQSLKPADENSIMELMKYFTKILPSKKSRATGKIEINAKALDTMFQAMEGVRVFQPFGITKHVSEDIEELEKAEYDIVEQQHGLWIWEQDVADWVDIISYQSLTGYEPEPITMDFISIIQARGTNHKPT